MGTIAPRPATNSSAPIADQGLSGATGPGGGEGASAGTSGSGGDAKVGVTVPAAEAFDEPVVRGASAIDENGPVAGAATNGAGATFRAALQPGPEQGSGGWLQVSQRAQPDEPTASSAAKFQSRDRDIGCFLSMRGEGDDPIARSGLIPAAAVGSAGAGRQHNPSHRLRRAQSPPDRPKVESDLNGREAWANSGGVRREGRAANQESVRLKTEEPSA